MSKAIGIDLGTTNSCVAVVEGGVPVVIPNENGGRTTPSVVAFTQNAERLVGSAALRQAVVNGERTVRSVKRHMGSDWMISVDGNAFRAQEISAMLLRKLRQDAEAYLGGPVTDAVITVPAYFNDVQRQATRDAGRIAGLNVLRIINEPTSAALAYGLDNGSSQKILVYDLGGGTFDVSVIEISGGVIEVLATCGDNHLGGDDFDERVTNELAEQYRQTHRGDLRRDSAAMQRLREAAEQAKKELSSTETAYINLPYLTQENGQPVHFEATLTRERFNTLTRDLVDRTAAPVQTAMRDAGVTTADLGRVLLVGGSTRIPAVQEKVRQLTGKIPSRNINPDECVAMGAAIQADTLSGGALTMSGGSGVSSAGAGTGILLLDVTPMSLSIETVGGVATRLIERNTTLPVRYSQVFTTAAPFQSSVEIHVLQGERPMARDNKTIGKFRLNGIQRAMAGVPQIDVCFDLDTNGILKVSAKDLHTGREQSVAITASDRMSDAEVEQARRDAEQYAAQDGLRRDVLTEMDTARRVLNRTEQALNRCQKEAEKSERKQVKADCATLQKQLRNLKLDKITPADLDMLRRARQTLETSGAHIREMAETMSEGQVS